MNYIVFLIQMCMFHYPWTGYLNKFSDQFVEGEKQLNDMVSGESLLIDCWEYLVLSLARYLLRPSSAPQSSYREFTLFSREPVLDFRNRQRYRFGQSKHHIPSATVIILWISLWLKATPVIFPQRIQHEVLSFYWIT